MVRVKASVRSALLGGAAVLMAAGLNPSPARAVELNDIAGWWIAVDDTFPKLWSQRSIAPQEELLQINADGRVTDRTMNFWAGGAQACFENKVCSDIPQIANAKLRVAGNRLSFLGSVPTTARLDLPATDAAIRGDVITARAEWTVAVDGDRMTLRNGNPARTRTLVRIDFDRLVKLRAAMRVSGFPPAESWRCFLGNATANEKAFAPLHPPGRSYAAPAFLDRYLKFASYINAINSAIAIPAIDETNEERRKLLSVETEELMVQHFDNLLRPPSVEGRHRLDAVLAYIDRHAKAMIAYDAAAATAAQAKSVADAAASEAAKAAANLKAATAAATAAAAAAKSGAADSERAQSASAAQAQAATDAAAAARTADTVAAEKDTAAKAAMALHDAAKRDAATQQQKTDAAGRAAADRQKKFDAATRQASELAKQSEAAKLAAAQQQQKSDAAKLAITERQDQYDMAKAAADEQERKHQDAARAAEAQQNKSTKTATAARDYAEALAALQKAFDDTALLMQRTGDAAQRFSSADAGAAPDAARDVGDATDTLKAALKVTSAAIKLALATRNRTQAAAASAAARAAELAAAAKAAGQSASEAFDAAKAAAALRDQAKATSDAAAREALRLADAARDAATRAADAATAATAALAARDKSKSDSETEAAGAAKLDDAAAVAGKAARTAQDISAAASSTRDKANSESQAAAREAVRRVEAARNAVQAAHAADDAAKAASAKEQQAKAQSDAAAQAAAKAEAASQAAAAIARNANNAMQAVAAAQPQGEGLVPISAADIAAYAHVLNRSDDAKRLFCRDEYRFGTPAVINAAQAAPLPHPAPTVGAAAPSSAPESKSLTVPLPVARPSTLRR